MPSSTLTQKITPFLWFDTQAEAAARFYTGIFNNSKITATTYYNEATQAVSGKAPGSVMTVAFELDGQEFVTINGGPEFQFTPAISLVVNCESQAEVDRMWAALLANGGQAVECGWLTDQFGVSWQVVPVEMTQLLAEAAQTDPARGERMTQALLSMKKIDLDRIRNA